MNIQKLLTAIPELQKCDEAIKATRAIVEETAKKIDVAPQSVSLLIGFPNSREMLDILTAIPAGVYEDAGLVAICGADCVGQKWIQLVSVKQTTLSIKVLDNGTIRLRLRDADKAQLKEVVGVNFNSLAKAITSIME